MVRLTEPEAPGDFATEDQPGLLGADAPRQLTPEQRALEEAKRSSVAGYDVDAPHVVTWHYMPPEARAAACAAAVFASWPLETKIMRYDPRARIAFAVLPDPYVKGRRRCAERAVLGTVDLVLASVAAAFGDRAAEIRRFIRRRA